MFARLLLLALMLVGAPVGAQTVETEYVRGEFHAEHESLAPGDTTTLAFDMTLAPGWHTYWKNAGDSGQPVEITWEVPEGVTVGEIEWPAPHRQPYPPMMNYGYEDSSILLIPLSLSDGWTAGEPVPVKADIFWLVCAEVCIPEQGTASFTLATGERTIPSGAAEAVFARARAALPQPSPFAAAYEVGDTHLRLRLRDAQFENARIEDAYFFPAEWGVIDHAGTQVATTDAGGLTLTIPRSPENDEAPEGRLDGVLKLVERTGDGENAVALAIAAEAGRVEGAAPVLAIREDGGTGIGLGWAVALAFLGGAILNLMPCVFPVLALKALGFAKMSSSSFGHRAAHGLAYTAGVVALFAALGAAFIGLRSAGMAIGWGFQLQDPYVVAGLAYLMFVIGLNLSGVFEVSSRLAGIGSERASGDSLRGAFFTGALTAIVATPCTAPFMGTAMGAALTMSSWQALAVFVALALGLAAPFLLLSISPAAARLMPKPGVWMERLKQFLAFPMYATAALLVWVLGSLAGPDAMLAAMIGGVFVGLAAWAWGVAQRGGERGRRWGLGTAAVSAAIAVVLVALIEVAPAQSPGSGEATDGLGEPYSTARLTALREAGKPVFLNMTADWCITCKVNEKVAFGAAFEEALREGGITYLKGDWTARDEEITALLQAFGRVGVPLYAVYPAQGDPILLPQILTPDSVVEALGRV